MTGPLQRTLEFEIVLGYGMRYGAASNRRHHGFLNLPTQDATWRPRALYLILSCANFTYNTYWYAILRCGRSPKFHLALMIQRKLDSLTCYCTLPALLLYLICHHRMVFHVCKRLSLALISITPLTVISKYINVFASTTSLPCFHDCLRSSKLCFAISCCRSPILSSTTCISRHFVYAKP